MGVSLVLVGSYHFWRGTLLEGSTLGILRNGENVRKIREIRERWDWRGCFLSVWETSRTFRRVKIVRGKRR